MEKTKGRIKRTFLRETWVNAETGEEREFSVIDTEVADIDFKKVWLANILSVVDIMGNDRIRFMIWVLDEMDWRNQIYGTYEDFAKKAGMSKSTVYRAMKDLATANVIRKVTNSVYVVNPELCFRGKHQGRMYVLLKYQQATPFRDEIDQESKGANPSGLGEAFCFNCFEIEPAAHQ